MSRRFTGVCLGALAILASARAAAQPVAARLDYTRGAEAASCPDAPALEDAVSRQLGYAAFERTPESHVVRVAIEGDGRGLRAQVDVQLADGTPAGSRALESSSRDCAELASALALAIGIALDPTRLFAPSAPSPPPVSECPAPLPCPVCPPAPQATDSERPPAADEEPAAAEPVSLDLAFGAELGLGALPAISGAGVVELSMRWAGLSAHLGAALHPGASGGQLATDDDPVEGQLLLGQLALCSRFPLADALTLGACAHGTLGALRGSGTDTGTRDASLHATLGPQARLALELSGRFFTEARAELHANLVHSRLRVGGEAAWQTPALWGALGIALGMRFS